MKDVTKEKNFISALVYVHNDEETIPSFLKHIYESLSAFAQNIEIVCVNDASSDASEEAIKKTAAGFDCATTIVNMGYMQGVELSMNAGEDIAIGDFVFEFDMAKVSWPKEMIEAVYRKMQEGFDIVSACPDAKGPLSSRIFYSVFNRFSNIRTKIGTEAFRLISRRALNRVLAINKAQMYRKAVNANSGLKQTALKFVPEDTLSKAQKSGRERRTLAVDSLIMFTDIGYKVAFSLSLIMLIFAAVVGIYVVVIYATGHPVEGWTPIMIFLALGFFALFAILTFVIKYLSLILNLNFKRQRYIVENIEKI